MATSSSSTPSSQASTNTTEVSDCPQCGSVCVGAFLLPCAHLSCRKCLRDGHGFKLICSICKKTLKLSGTKGPEDFTSLVQQLGVDPVMVQLVDQRLMGQGRQPCVACENREATSLCHDCKEQYCDGCAKGHKRLGLTKDHVLQTLPQALHNASSASCAVSRPRTDSASTRLSASSTDSLESIRNPMDQPTSRGQSRGTKQWKQWVKQQVRLIKAALSEQDTAVTSLNDVISRAQQVLIAAQARQQLLQAYVQSLPSLAVTDHSDVDTFNVTFDDDDVSVQVKMDALQNRLRDVIHQQSSSFASDVTSLIVVLQDLLTQFGPSAPTTTTRTRTTTTTTAATTTTTTAATSPPTVDPMKATPRRAFTMTPTTCGDKNAPRITSIVSIEDGQRLVMSDYNNRKVKVVDMHHPHNVSASLTLNETPWSLAVLPDTLIAVTTLNKVIYLLKVTGTNVTVSSRITTNIAYSGIAGHSDGNLIVSCGRGDNNGVARIDILSRSGSVVKTIADSKSLTQLQSPLYLYVIDNHVYASENVKNAVFKVNLNTGQLLDTMTHTELKSPRQITADTSGHLYIAGWDSHAVLVRSPSRQWRKLVEASQHSDQGFDYPRGVCVTSSGRLVVSWSKEITNSIVIAYDL